MMAELPKDETLEVQPFLLLDSIRITKTHFKQGNIKG
jgi:hypothetical protein